MDTMNTTAFRPNKGRYLVLPDPVKSQETKIEGSEYTIESSKDPHAKPSEGTVIAIGKECTEYTPGARVLYGRFSGYEQLFDGVNYLILAETEILGERLVTPFDYEPGGYVGLNLRPGQTLMEAYQEHRDANATGICDGNHRGPACSPQCWQNTPLL